MPTTDIEVCPQVHDADTSTNVDVAKDDQYTGLRRVAGPIPWLLFLICVVEFGERFVYFGVSAPLQNYIQHPYPFDPETGIPGALNKGQAVGAALGNLLKFWSYLCTVIGAIVADQWLGKFKTILASSPIYIAGMVLLVATATPVAINSGASFGGLIASIILIGLGTGGLKACIAPLCGEQNTETGERLKTLKTGEELPLANITIVAKHTPGDYDIEYASPWAGANYAPVSVAGSKEAEYDSKTWPELHKLALRTPEAGVHLQENVVYNREKDAQSATAQWFSGLLSSKPWFSDVVPNFRQLDQEELPEGISSGISYTSVCINTPQYLHYLLGKCVAAGVVVNRSILHNISDARLLHSSGRAASIVVNCTGLGAATLGGVLDSAVYPARGHVVLLRNNTAGRITFVSGTDDGPEETTYVMQRPAGGGTIVGGCYQAGKTEADPDPAMGERILERAIKLVPDLADGKGRAGLDVIRHGVGLRPVRKGGYRVGWNIVHNYGHGGAGYQCSYGCAGEAVKLVKEATRAARL